ncbi:MAG: hypothetical protein A2X84_05170 [Desulfuromonadaceae bacterium GWC2_58_13]|nr:MAG: hypothetical protein A2X84_05170 [Desulfuromonadaceae bacterium GWC2_58_13]
MRKILISALILLPLGLFAVADAEAAKIKHQQTIYADIEGIALHLPEGVACDDKTLAVADTGNSRVVIYRLEAQAMVAKTVLPLEGLSPIVIRMNSRGELYLLDGRERAIVKLGADGKIDGKLKPENLPNPQNFVPRSFDFDQQDHLYLVDIFAGRVLILDGTGQFLRQIPFPEKHGSFADIAVSPQGAVYLLDSVAGAIYAAGPEAESFTLLSQGLKEFMNFPTSLALDGQGNLYLSDQYGSGLAVVSRDGTFLGRKFGLGWEDGQLYYPAQLCINDQGALFVADRNNNRVQVFSILEE